MAKAATLRAGLSFRTRVSIPVTPSRHQCRPKIKHLKDDVFQVVMLYDYNVIKRRKQNIFFHPDFTVGSGITPDRLSLAG